MRIRAVTNNAVACTDHCLRDIGVQIEHRHDRHAFANDGAYEREVLAIGIGGRGSSAGTVAKYTDAIKWPSGSQLTRQGRQELSEIGVE